MAGICPESFPILSVVQPLKSNTKGLTNLRIGKPINEIHILYIPIDKYCQVLYKFIYANKQKGKNE